MLGLTVQNPWNELANLHRDLDAIVGRMFQGIDQFDKAFSFDTPGDLVRENDTWKLTMPIPGIDPSAVHIEAQGRTIRIRAEEGEPGKNAEANGTGKYTLVQRQLTVPDDIDLDKVEARYNLGVLELLMPLKESAKPRRIAINGVTEVKQLQAA
jgi:HSP20 family protein